MSSSDQQQEDDHDAAAEPTQSLPLCILFASISGLLRVCATMLLAYPDFLEKKKGSPPRSKVIYIVFHLVILAIAAVLSIAATIYGPVSIAVPVQTGACLLFNVVAMGIVLQMRAFDKAQRTGTYVVFFSILSLIDVGPGIQDGQKALSLLSSTDSILWSLLVTALMVFAGVGTVVLVRSGSDATSANSMFMSWFNLNATLILALGTTMSNVAMATSSKAFASLHGFAFAVAVLYYLMATFLGVLFSIVSSTACDQGIFTPLSSVALIVTNMVTGIIIWEDWKVIDTWIAYVCACLLMSCGVYLLAEVDILEFFSRKALANIVNDGESTSLFNTNCATTNSYSAVTQEENLVETDTDAWQAILELEEQVPP